MLKLREDTYRIMLKTQSFISPSRAVDFGHLRMTAEQRTPAPRSSPSCTSTAVLFTWASVDFTNAHSTNRKRIE